MSVTLREGTNFAVAAAPGGAVVMDLHNMLFRVPSGGGRARQLTNLLVEAARPDVAADGRITFQAYADGQAVTQAWTVCGPGSEVIRSGWGRNMTTPSRSVSGVRGRGPNAVMA